MITSVGRIAAILLVVFTGLVHTPMPAAELEAQLAPQLVEVLRRIEANEAGLDGDMRQKIATGAMNFFLPFPGGNGRSCATCHDPKDGFSLSPATVEERWQRLQRARRHDPRADDPLFRSVRGFPLPLIPDEDVAYMKKAF